MPQIDMAVFMGRSHGMPVGISSVDVMTENAFWCLGGTP